MRLMLLLFRNFRILSFLSSTVIVYVVWYVYAVMDQSFVNYLKKNKALLLNFYFAIFKIKPFLLFLFCLINEEKSSCKNNWTNMYFHSLNLKFLQLLLQSNVRQVIACKVGNSDLLNDTIRKKYTRIDRYLNHYYFSEIMIYFLWFYCHIGFFF